MTGSPQRDWYCTIVDAGCGVQLVGCDWLLPLLNRRQPLVATALALASDTLRG